MTMPTVNDLRTPIGEVLDLAGAGGVLVQAEGEARFALMPLDDDLLDFLIERNPRFIDECRQIRRRMQNGVAHTQAEIEALFGRNQSPIR